MPRAKIPKGRASQAQVDQLHGEVAASIAATFKHHRKTKTLAPAAFISTALKFLDMTGSTDARRSLPKGPTALDRVLADYVPEDENGNPIDPATDFSTTLPDRDASAPIPRHPSREFDD
jgi:hypothetical protein